MRNVTPFLILSLLLAACSKSPETPERNAASGAAAEPVINPGILLRGDGLTVVEPEFASELRFGTTTVAEAEKALAAFGQPKASQSSEECPTGQLDYRDWPNQLQLAFQQDRLVGWWAFDDATGLATAGGIRPGSPRSALDKTEVQQASFGNVFTIDEVNGLLNDEKASKVTAMWAGAACIFDGGLSGPEIAGGALGDASLFPQGRT